MYLVVGESFWSHSGLGEMTYLREVFDWGRGEFWPIL